MHRKENKLRNFFLNVIFTTRCSRDVSAWNNNTVYFGHPGSDRFGGRARTASLGLGRVAAPARDPGPSVDRTRPELRTSI